MTASSSSKRDGGRTHLRLPPDLKRKLERHAKRNHTTVTALVVRAVVKLLREEEVQVGVP